MFITILWIILFYFLGEYFLPIKLLQKSYKLATILLSRTQVQTIFILNLNKQCLIVIWIKPDVSKTFNIWIKKRILDKSILIWLVIQDGIIICQKSIMTLRLGICLRRKDFLCFTFSRFYTVVLRLAITFDLLTTFAANLKLILH